jgi:branched-subunit amino acid aminotransferase/4-amino-4-deoxychorismate lyase
VRQWAAQAKISFNHRDIPISELSDFDEIILTSTPFAALPLVSIDGRWIGNGSPGPIYRRLMDEWSSDVGINIVEQANQFALNLSPAATQPIE